MRISDDHWLINKPIAHRGLWNDAIVENSVTAYKKAAEYGYPIEIDLYLTKDYRLVSLHDLSLDRITGVSANVCDKTLEELKTLRLFGTEEQIPTFDEVLEIAENKVPLLIEIKNQPNKKVVDAVVARLKDYKGEFAIQSFNPLYIKRVKKLAPEFIRGILTTGEKNHIKKNFASWVVKNMPFNFLVKPDFISIFYGNLPLKKSKAKNKRIITWTIINQETANKIKPYAENIIFEHFIPEQK